MTEGEHKSAFGRTLSDADVQAIAEALERRLSNAIVTRAGRGVLKLAWQGLLLLIVGLACYAGASHLVNR